MTNELVKNENVSVEVVDNTSVIDYNVKKELNIVGLTIKCKKIKLQGKPDFNSVKGMLYLPVYDKEGVFKGHHNRWIDVHFKQDAFTNNKGEGLEITSPQQLTTGTLWVRLKGVQTPSKYQVTEGQNEDGTTKDVYPQIWIKSDVVGFTPYTPDEEVFKYHEPDKSINVNSETGEVLDTEGETKPFTDNE